MEKEDGRASPHAVREAIRRRAVSRAVEQDREVVRRWLNEEWLAIPAAAKADKAMIFFGDESNLCSNPHRGTTWDIKGETPVVAKTGRRFSLNLISAVSPLGELRFMVTDP